MAYLRKGSSRYVIRHRSLVGYGDTGEIATGLRDRRAAERLESVLVELAERAVYQVRYRPLLDAICGRSEGRRLPLADVMRARQEGRLDAIVASLSDPLLKDAFGAPGLEFDVPSQRGAEKVQRAGPKGPALCTC